MNILVDIGHPAHVHYFKYVIRNLEAEGHTVFISARERYPVFELLEAYGLDYYNRGKGKDKIFNKLISIPKTNYKIYKFAKSNKIDLIVGCTFYVTHVGFLLRKPSIMLDDTDNATLSQILYRPFATRILSPKAFTKNFGIKHKKYNGYIELAYLHPKYFKKRQVQSLKKPYVLFRFVSWNAYHDIGHQGISITKKIEIIKTFLRFTNVYISSECQLPSELEQYRINIHPEDMHNLIANASLLFGESATMASEAAVLGTPSIFIDNKGRSYTTDQEKEYGLVYNYTEDPNEIDKALLKGVHIVCNTSKKEWADRQIRLINDHEDIMLFILNEIRSFQK